MDPPEHSAFRGLVNRRFTPRALAPLADSIRRCAVAALNAAVTKQAAMIAYNNDFQLMLFLCIAAAPLVVLLRKGTAKRSAEPVIWE